MSAPAPGCLRCGGAGWVTLHAVRRHGIAAAEASCPVCCGPSPAQILQWRAASGWSPTRWACRWCGEHTHVRDEAGAPAHQICAARATGLRDAAIGGELR